MKYSKLPTLETLESPKQRLAAVAIHLRYEKVGQQPAVSALHDYLAAQINLLLLDETHPEWIIEGQTVLLLLEGTDPTQLQANSHSFEAHLSHHNS